MKNEIRKEKAEAFMLGFFITLLVAALAVLLMTAFYRMESTMSKDSFGQLSIEQDYTKNIKATVNNKIYIFNFNEAKEKYEQYSYYDFLIPSQIKLIAAGAEGAAAAVSGWLEELF